MVLRLPAADKSILKLGPFPVYSPGSGRLKAEKRFPESASPAHFRGPWVGVPPGIVAQIKAFMPFALDFQLRSD
jgi:hypothetical protein